MKSYQCRLRKQNKIFFRKNKFNFKGHRWQFPDYQKVIPKENKEVLVVDRNEFINSVERVAPVSLDRKEGVKLI